jgi:hypothetical protein
LGRAAFKNNPIIGYRRARARSRAERYLAINRMLGGTFMDRGHPADRRHEDSLSPIGGRAP